jgi:hypothetical protein
MIATIDLNIIAYSMLARDDIADLRATRDAAELADFLINSATLPDTITDHDTDDLHLIMTSMIMNPID